MTTEETELTFIRCPSCRSLVPAVATRCRMCGYSFESAGEGGTEQEGQEGAKGRSRVRQRTISATKEQMEGVGSFEEMGGQPADDRQEGAAGEEPEETSNVLESFSAAILEEDRTEQRSPGIAVQEPDVFGDQNDTEPQGEEMFVVQSDEAGPPEEEPQESFFDPPAPVEEPVPEFEAAYAQEAEGYPAEELHEAFAADEDAEAQVDQSGAEEKSGDEGAPGESDDRDSDSENERQADDSVSEGKPSGRKRKRRKRKRRGGTEVSEQTEQQASGQSAVNGANAKIKSPPAVTGEAGILVGWLVNFATDPKGVSTELRSGRFFMGRQQLRKHDMVIDRDGVSTPHCLVAVDRGQLCVQDLMSERGTYLQRLGSDTFEEVTDLAEIEHGDRLKIGDYEVMVCLLPSE